MLTSVEDVVRLFPERAEPTGLKDYFRRVCGVELQELLAPRTAPGGTPPVPWGTAAALTGPRAPQPPVDVDDDVLPFGTWLFAVVHDELVDLCRRIEGWTRLADPDGLRERLLTGLHTSLYNEAIRTVVAELYAARTGGCLLGETPEERFASFVSQVRSRAAHEYLRARYPRLHDRLRTLAHDRITHLGTVLDTTFAESAALARTFEGVAPDFVVEQVDMALGDSHRGGRTVTVLHLSGGVRLVHKPRDVRIDAAFRRLLDELRGHAGLDLVAPAIHVTEDAGWCEFVQGRPVAPAAAADYYRRMGRLTAILHLIDGRDIHFENVICDGTRPVVVDLETMLHPRPVEPVPYGTGSAAVGAGKQLEKSVVAIGVLPAVVSRAGAAETAYHVGAVGYVPGAMSPMRSYVLRNDGRDDMHVAFETIPVETTPEVPLLEVAPGVAEQAASQMGEGFREVYDWALAHRDELVRIAHDAFADVVVRYIHNPTHYYVQLLRMASHPSFEGDPRDARVLFHRVGLRRPDSDPRIVQAEIEDLVRGDVPYFSAHATSTDLVTSDGEAIRDILDRAPLDTVLDKIRSVSTEDRDLQLDLIATAFLSKRSPEGDVTGTRLVTDGPPARRDDLLRTAVEIGDALVRGMVRSTSPTFPSTWIGPLVTSGEAQLWQPGVLGQDLYGGSTGIALALAQLAQETGDARYASAARSVAEPIASQLDHGEWAGTGSPCGFLVGLAGTAYTVARIGTALGDDHLVAAGVRGARSIASLVPDDQQLDLVSGSAGALAVALRLHALTSDEQARESCLRTARLAHQHLREHHPAFTGADGEQYTGFAHGLAGIHGYLRVLALTTGDATVAADADTLVERERALRDPATGRWWMTTRRERMALAWCNGVTGVLLSRLLALRAGHPEDDVIRAEVSHALDEVRRDGLGHDVTYCHGDLGVLDVLRLASEVLDDAVLGRQVAATTRDLHERALAEFSTRRRSRYAHVDSLLFGAAGVVHGLLRSRSPESVPSFLWVD